MSHFAYQSKNTSGEIHKGEKDAKDRYELYKLLRDENEEIISFKESSGRSLSSLKNISINIPFIGGIKTQEKINFAKNLGSMISAGLALSRALSVMERQTKNKELKKVLVSLQKSISEGKALSQAMSNHKSVFSQLFISMVAAGEQSGNIASSLKIVGDQLDKNYALQRKVRGAMMYPAIIVCVMILIAFLMLTYIVPTLMKTFKELKLELPSTTKLVLFVSDLVVNHTVSVLMGAVVVLGSLYLWSKKESGKKFIHMAILRIPIIGNIVKEVNSARTARTMSSLLTSGVDVITSVRITKDVIQNVHYRDVLERVAVAVEKGDTISKVFTDNTKLYPIFIGEMISVGEETGKIGEMLMGVANFYEEDVEQKTKDMSTIIEPFLMVIIGGAVGFFALAMISPMYSLVDVI